MADLEVAAKLLDYLYPICTLIAFILIFSVDWLILRTRGQDEKHPRGRRTALAFTVITLITYAIQVVLNLVHALRQRGWDVPEHRIVGTMGLAFVWGVVSAILTSIRAPVWDPFIGVWVLGLCFEAAVIGVAAPDADRSVYDLSRVSLQGIRIGALLVLAANIYRIVPGSKPEQRGDNGESEALLSGTTDDGSQLKRNGYGSIDTASESDDEPDADKELKESQRQRLESHGGWWGYIKEFKIFIPYLIPYKNRKVQFCIVMIVFKMILDRFVNVMVPRQLGIITDELARDYTIMPWRQVLVWVVLRWANSFASFGLIADVAHTHLHNWSSAQIKGLAFKHVMHLSMNFHANKDSGDLIKSIGQAESLNDLLETVFFEIGPIFIDIFIAFIYITHLFDAAMALVVLMVGFLFVWTSIMTTARTRPKRRVYTEKSREESKTLYECVSNWPTISYFNRTMYEEDRYEGAVQAEMKAQITYYISNALGYALQYLILYTGLVTVAMMAIFQISEGRKPIGNFVTLVMYWSTMMSPLHMITYQYRRISGATVDAERLLQLLQTEPSVKSKLDAQPLNVGKGRVVFEDVSFSYDERKETLKGLNFTVQPGQTLALVGETGGGKSSTLKLLFRFYDVTTGSICIDGQDIRDVTVESLREELGVVPQDPSLFNQTIMENVRYARLEASDDEVVEACKAAAVHEKIISFPDQYRSKVGERGVKLSGGELQRIAIARVILKNPKIVLLDEATSAVDSAIEAQIQAAFKKLSAGRTTFVVAHRLSTIMDADLILVIDHGEIIERGAHEELIKKRGKYFELWTKQTTGKGSKANSFLEIPGDIDPAIRNDLTPTTYSEEIKKAFITDDEDGTIMQLDGACESKPNGDDEDAACFGLKKDKKSKQRDEIDSRSNNAVDTSNAVRIADPNRSTSAATSVARPGSQRGDVSKARAGQDSVPPSVVNDPPATSTDDRQWRPEVQLSAAARSPNPSPLSMPHIPKVAVSEAGMAHPSWDKASSRSSPSNDGDSHAMKSTHSRKPTGYPKQMPGGKDRESSSEDVITPTATTHGAHGAHAAKTGPSSSSASLSERDEKPGAQTAGSSLYSFQSSTGNGRTDSIVPLRDTRPDEVDSTRATRRPTQASLLQREQEEAEEREAHGNERRTVNKK